VLGALPTAGSTRRAGADRGAEHLEFTAKAVTPCTVLSMTCRSGGGSVNRLADLFPSRIAASALNHCCAQVIPRRVQSLAETG